MALPPHLYTPTRHAGVIESRAGVSERGPRVSILLITILFQFYDALSVPDKERKQMRGGGGSETEHVNGGGSSCRVITWLNDQRSLSQSRATLAPSAQYLKCVPVSV